ncbi:7-carboxy-7-deazaguanine synthase [Geomicrobium halophilum]|uniref:7-carboxy-7-deazaguanine synthase n=1 Tax=Geomicrobium halophilum TaxID=549000 RepID=A0A841PUP4_9BACL|nr:7-carboxy-7-deazaguanine synthase QueE [Geomicrobium halophilum]MBB6450856.1 7-carboxy-7-deazaguanine synthase [Geomicrobium halophilum]
MSRKIPVLEIFGPTVQGEGIVAGQKTMFVRTGGCDYRCSWCDSAFTWDGSQKPTPMAASEIMMELEEKGGNRFSHVTISGGNPALHAGIADLLELFRDKGIESAVETQGSFWQDWLLAVDDVTISPKPPSSQMNTDWSRLDTFMTRLSERQKGNHSLKIVIFNEEDITYAKQVHNRYPGVPFYLQVGNDDLENPDPAHLRDQLLEKYEWLVERIMEDEQLNHVRVLPQIHALLWGNKQGV